MDSITVDVSSLPAETLHCGSLVDLICEEQTLDDVARAGGTIAYDVLTGLDDRFFSAISAGGGNWRRRLTGSGKSFAGAWQHPTLDYGPSHDHTRDLLDREVEEWKRAPPIPYQTKLSPCAGSG
jgi:hypothetical protein